ncbi:hypothetical protein Pcinc_025629 [Petrolisthes cinctipes]|uniref:Coiled-coil-helix-coiled-coil-helix domain-containing protein 7 n=1 Tax=Petrolisthes cinctipes TaxID=88211 RepID=A0AAE1F149_PETCI|nr:hypothetical protein Pcinc_029375 [Petrolisthes cinctipes]KAK3869033.1 hypothetical protein Pcinc_025629 [Petrolisthes cinctipes]
MDSSDETKNQYSSNVYTTPSFSWNHENSKQWNEMKVHPASGCKMTDTNITHQDNNPCINEYHLSMKCNQDKTMDREACTPYYQNYRICKVFWTRVVRDRKARGITPIVPPVAERETVKQQYLQKKGFKP